MKICKWCGTENKSKATSCIGCGKTAFTETEFKSQWREFLLWLKEPISTLLKHLCWWSAWGMVIITSLVINPISLGAFYAFPLGLLVWLPNGEQKAIGAWMMIFPIFAGWIIYILSAIILFQTKKRIIFFLTYIIFCVLIALNVIGCQKVMETVKGIY